jgi:hypothetical protein
LLALLRYVLGAKPLGLREGFASKAVIAASLDDWNKDIMSKLDPARVMAVFIGQEPPVY